MEASNANVQSDIIQIICKDCKIHFFVAQGELDWLKEKGLAPYKRCPICREKRRQRDVANHIQEAATNNG